MSKRWALHPVTIATLLALLLFGCGAAFLADKAPRDWSLHWMTPRALLIGVSTNDYALTPTVRGWDVLWSDPQNHLRLSRVLRNGKRAAADIVLAGAGQQIALAYAAGTDFAAWREDFNGSSRIRLATLAAGTQPLYGTVADGKQPLEHPSLLPVPGGALLLFGWERPNFDLYLSRVSMTGRISTPVQLTHAVSYALLPRVVLDARGLLRMIWLDRNSDGSAFDLRTARFTLDGRRVGTVEQLDSIAGASGADHQSTPARWGLALSRSGSTTRAAWAGDQGIMLATWHGDRQIDTHLVVSVPPPPALALAVLGGSRELVWQQPTDTGVALFNQQLDANGYPSAEPDRVVFEPAIDEQPTPTVLDRQPAVAWESTPGNGSATRIEISRYTPKEQGPANLWVRFGLGLANPFAGLALLLVGSIAVGVLLTVGNVLLIFLLVALYLLTARLVPTPVRWYGYAAFLGVALYILLIRLKAPFPPVVAFSAFTPGIGLLAIGGMTIFVLVISLTWLRRIDDLYRAAAMTFTAFYFLAFLQALAIIQGQIGKI